MNGGFDSKKPRSGVQKSVRLEEEVEVLEFPDNQWVQMRFIGPITSRVNIWFPFFSKKEKRVKSFPVLCTDYNPETEEFEGKSCPYRSSEKKKGGPQQFYVANAIIREIEEDKPSKLRPLTESEKKRVPMLGGKWHLKDKSSRSWTPCRVVNMTSTLVEKLQGLKALNKHVIKGKKKYFDVTHPKFGCDVMVKFNSKGTGTGKWEAQKAERTKITEKEEKYLLWSLEGLKSLTPASRDFAKRDIEEKEKTFIVTIDEKGKMIAGPGGKKLGGRDEDDEDDDYENDLDEKKSKKKSSRDEDDEDDEPVKKKKKKSSSSSSSKDKKKKKKKVSLDDEYDI